MCQSEGCFHSDYIIAETAGSLTVASLLAMIFACKDTSILCAIAPIADSPLTNTMIQVYN